MQKKRCTKNNEKDLDFCEKVWYCVLPERMVKKMTTPENLYYGNISPVEVQYTKGSEYDNAIKLVLKNDSALTATLTDEQQEMYQQLKDAKPRVCSVSFYAHLFGIFSR